MAKDRPILIKDVIFKLQLSLLEGIQNVDQLHAAGSLMSRSDYEDVVTERSIGNTCGYPLCRNPLRARKGRFQFSLKECKLIDLQETYMFCSSSCCISSKAFARSFRVERCSVLDPKKLNNLLGLFGDMNLGLVENLQKDENSGLSGLKIQEKTETSTGEVSLEQWVGPSNAIEGYVPKQRDSDSKGSSRKTIKKGSKSGHGKLNSDKYLINNEMDFMSTIIIPDEYSISKESTFEIKPTAIVEKPKRVGSKVVREDDDNIQELSSSFESGLNLSTSGKEKEPRVKEVATSCDSVLTSSLKPSSKTKLVHSVSISERQCDAEQNDCERKSAQHKGETSKVAVSDDASSTSNLDAVNVEKKIEVEKTTASCKTKHNPSLKSKGQKKSSRSVTWADEKINTNGSNALCEVKEFEDIKYKNDLVGNTDVADDENVLRRASAEACAIALSQASEAVAAGESDVTDAVSEAGIIILPRPLNTVEEGTIEDVDLLETDSVSLKWPRKPGISDVDLFDSQDSWYDAPPEGFSLTLSPFATMWNALFTWITSSSLAYIYGRDESFHEEYLAVNGREYPRKIVLEDGRSSEIKQTLAGCLGRALPALVAELRLPIPISTLEQGMACLLDTMSFVDALPAFRSRQWQVVALLLIDALSVSRIPTLLSYMTDRRAMFHKVLSGTQLGMEEYEILKDLIVPLGRAPHFSAQSGA